MIVKKEGGKRFNQNLTKYDPNWPVVTVVTAVYNGIEYIEETIISVLNQSYPNLEYIVVDGGSSDGTLEILRKYEDQIDYWISEKDKGISDAFNKGISFATGDFINFQGDGDGFLNPNSVVEVFKNLDSKKYKFVSARIQRIDLKGNILYQSKKISKFNKSSLMYRMSLPHQGLFTHRSIFEKYGLFDISNKFCMDYEHLLRAYKDFPEVLVSDVVVANWRADGLGTGREREILKEYNKIKMDNKIAPFIVLIILNAFIVSKYYIKKMLKFDR